jgi:DNA-binding CsgD family transcriptional regulator
MTLDQRLILSLLAAGRTLPQVASEIDLSYDQVKEHMRSIRRSLGARNSTHAVAIAIRKRHIW